MPTNIPIKTHKLLTNILMKTHNIPIKTHKIPTNKYPPRKPFYPRLGDGRRTDENARLRRPWRTRRGASGAVREVASSSASAPEILVPPSTIGHGPQESTPNTPPTAFVGIGKLSVPARGGRADGGLEPHARTAYGRPSSQLLLLLSEAH